MKVLPSTEMMLFSLRHFRPPKCPKGGPGELCQWVPAPTQTLCTEWEAAESSGKISGWAVQVWQSVLCLITSSELPLELKRQEQITKGKPPKSRRNKGTHVLVTEFLHAHMQSVTLVWTEAKMLFAGLSKLNKIRSSPSAGPADSRGQMPARNWKEVVYLHSMCQSIRAPQTKGVWIIDGAAA